MTTKEFQLKESGIILPVKPPEKPEVKQRKYQLLEVQWDDDRKELQDIFTKMLNLASIRGAIPVPYDLSIVKVRQKAVIHLAELLLGDDFSYEELC